MVGCAIRNCKNRSVKGGTSKFFSFPKQVSVAEEWLQYCSPKTKIKTGRVCSNHFISSDYNKSLRHILLNYAPSRSKILKPDAVPTQNINNINRPVIPTNVDDTGKPNVSPVRDKDFKQNDTSVSNENHNTNRNDKNHDNHVSDKNHDNHVSDKNHDNHVSDKNHDNHVSDKNHDNHVSEENHDSHVREENDNSSNKTITISLTEYKALQKTANKFNVLKNNLNTIFTPGQIRCLMTPNKRRVRWSDADISAAISLKSITPKGYHHLRTKVGIPLPALSTLRQWTSKCPGKEDDESNRRPRVKQKKDTTENEDSEMIHQPKDISNDEGNIRMEGIECEVTSDDENDTTQMSDSIKKLQHNIEMFKSKCHDVYNDNIIIIEIGTETPRASPPPSY